MKLAANTCNMDVLYEGDETVTLSEILSLRDAYLNEEELWALCRECCLTLEYVRNSQDMFQSLCITPETVAFDQSGNVCFLDLEEEPEPLYVAPEFEDVGNSFKSHLFSLGMTMLYGVEYNIQTEEPKHDLSPTLSDLLTNLCADDHSQRPSLIEVIKLCDDILEDRLSQYICSCMITNFIRGSPVEKGTTILDLTAGLSSYLNTQSTSTPRQSTPQDPGKKTSSSLTHVDTSNDSNYESDEYLLAKLGESNKSKKSLSASDQILGGSDKELEELEGQRLEYSELCEDSSTTYKDVEFCDNTQENCDKVKSDIYTPASATSDINTTINSEAEEIITSTLILNSAEMECLDLSSILEITREKLDSLDLWALISEGTKAIQKKKRHLPAYISPDTTVIKENGSIIFTAVPEGKQLETKYMAPELQQKGIFSEKTCLYGLAMTLQTVGGNDDMEEKIQDMLLSMLHTNSDKRPTLADTLHVCNELQSLFEVTSKDGCKQLLQRAWNYYSEEEENMTDQVEISLNESEVQNTSIESTSTQSSEPITSIVTKTTAPTPVSAFKPIHPETMVKPVAIRSQSSAFKPVPGKIQTLPLKPKPVYSTVSPSKQEIEEDAKNSQSSTPKSCDIFNESEKGTKVLKKLKDLEQHLLRHRSVEETKSPEVESELVTEVNNNEILDVKKGEMTHHKTDDALGQLLQKFDGQLPDTDTLATAIAQYLQTQIGSKVEPTPVNSAVAMHEISPIENSNSRTQDTISLADEVKMSVVNTARTNLSQPLSHQASNTSLSTVTTSSSMQTFNMPFQYASGQLASYPVQLQLQQDPNTGVVQLFPISMMPYGAVLPSQQTNASNSADRKIMHLNDVGIKNNKFEDDTIPEHQSFENSKYVQGKPPIHSRSAKHLIKKTAQSRAKNNSQEYMSDSGIPDRRCFSSTSNVSPGKYCADDNSFRLTSNNARKQIQCLQNELEQSFSSRMSGDWRNKGDGTFLSDDVNFGQPGNKSLPNLGSRSVNSSPSLSKDSGVSGIHLNHNNSYHGDTSLMDRLLSNDNSQQQKILSQVIEKLHEDNILDEVRLDDFAVAEYITSLGNLRIDTFTSAICEKYHQAKWNQQLLYTLYEAVNNRYQRQSKNGLTRKTNNSAHNEQRRKSAPIFVQNLKRSPDPDNSSTASEISSRLNSSHINKSSPSLALPLTQRSRSSPYHQTSGISETSDSTDTERIEKRRKFKKRYQLDRSKSSSMNNLGANNTTPQFFVNSHANQKGSETIASGNHRDQYMPTFGLSRTVHASFKIQKSKSASVNSNIVGTKPEYLSLNGQDSCDIPHNIDIRNCDSSNDNRSSNGVHSRNAAKINQSNYQSDSSRKISSNKDISSPTNKYSSVRSSDFNQFYVKPKEIDQHFNSLQRRSNGDYHNSDFGRADSYISDHINLQQQHSINQNFYKSPDKHYSADELSPPVELQPHFKSNMASLNHSTFTSPAKPNIRPLSSNTKEMINRRYLSKNSSDSEGSSSRSDTLPVKGRHDIVTRSSTSRSLIVLSENGNNVPLKGKVHIMYHWTAIQHNMTTEVESFINQTDEKNRAGIETKLSSVEQQLGMEKKMRKKSQKFYKKLIDPDVKNGKGDQKGVASQVLKDLEDMTKKVHILQLFKTHLQMLLVELYGIDECFCYSLALDVSNDVLILQPYEENPLLQFQCMVEPHTGCNIQVLQAGEPHALLAYLFVSSAVKDGFVHQFLYCYRYFITSENLLDFILHRYTAALRSKPGDRKLFKIRQRALDILHFWVEGFYSVDFESNKTLLFCLEQFLMSQMSKSDENRDKITDLLNLCTQGIQLNQSATSIDEKDEDEPTLYLKLDSPKKWNSFKSLTKKSPPKQRVQSFKDLTSLTKGTSSDIDDGFYPRVSKRNDTFTILDYTPQCLVEQLTLIAQDIFHLSHPIQYLNSKADGVCVALSLPGLRTPSMLRKLDNVETKSLFVGEWKSCKILDQLISLSHNISQWVAGEIVSCSNPKVQTQILTKFINVAQVCEEIRNYLMCIAVIEGLENLIVRQLPIWRNISSKYITIMENLSAMKMKLKSEPFYLIRDMNFYQYPTIPDVLYFLLHVQQMEMGNFRLANGLMKWTKIRTIVQLIDQIRIFRSNEYGFEPNYDIQDNIFQRVDEFTSQDIQSIASQNDTNFRRLSSGGLHGVLRKVKDKLGSRN
ncbi:uncharacterized protein LOC126814532 isoform X2 [Patella vulgata]|uniref:uncharacterized protein LOC126814532 isoform X2 n=1 Tax=Patella vulgata TaxID=6465 RepID=UPI0024A9FB83|nr:uncharacterized protein LOC126814532 isoform X2 [Patella vulgata]